MKKIDLNEIVITHELEPGDLGYVIYLHGKLYKEEYGFGVPFEGYVIEGIHEFYHNYHPRNQKIWICKHHGRMIGFMVLMNRGDAAQLRYFIIEPEYRGIGLGKKLIDEFMMALKEFGYRSCYLLTTHELHAAAHLYLSKGFRLTEENDSDSFGRPLKEQRYDLTLK